VIQKGQSAGDLDPPAPFEQDLRCQLRLLALACDLPLPTQAAPPRHARVRQDLRGAPSERSRREASRRHPGLGSARWSVSGTYAHQAAMRSEPPRMLGGCGWIRPCSRLAEPSMPTAPQTSFLASVT